MSENRFPDWGKIYTEQKVEEMPWYYPELDPDLDQALREKNLTRGAFLDLGTGPGTQAAALAQRGFTVTGTDLSAAAVEGARARIPGVEFLADDILHSTLGRRFDCIFDRGCFHVFQEAARPAYVEAVASLLHPGGYLFLKCFSAAMPETGLGPYRFAPEDIRALFTGKFKVESVRPTIFQGTRTPEPKALFATLKVK